MNDLNFRGLICGPSETLEEFYKRCEFFKEIKQQPQLLKNILQLPEIVEHKALKYEDLDLKIDWLFVNPSKKGFLIWEAAATWTIEVDEVAIPLLQVKTTSKAIQEDILKHEAVHIARIAFKEPIYEEFLAYATSKTRWRKFLGPLFRFPKESLIFVILSFCPLLNLFFPISMYLLLSPLLIFSIILLGRLFFHYRVFIKALSNIASIFDVKSPLALALRLTDKEIHLFAFSRLEELYQYMNKRTCPRWKQILSSYQLKATNK